MSRRNFLLQFFKLMPDFLGKLACIDLQLLKKLFEKPGVFFLKAAGTVTVQAKSPVLREGNTTVGVPAVFVNRTRTDIIKTPVFGSLDSCAFAVLVLQDLEQRFSLVLLQEIKFEVEDDV